MTIARVDNHADAGAASLIERYRKPLVQALLRSYLDETQELEDALHAMLTDVFTRQPDVVGRIVGQPREGRSDADYWLWIRARVRANRSSGRTRELLEIAQILGVPGLRYEELYPAGFVVHADATYDWAIGAQVARLLRAAKGAGIGGAFHWYGATPFRFAVAPDAPDLNSANGFNRGVWSSISDGSATLAATVEPPVDDSLYIVDDDDVYVTDDNDVQLEADA